MSGLSAILTPISPSWCEGNAGATTARGEPARLKLPLHDSQPRRDLGIVAAHLLDKPLGVLAADEHLDRVTDREVG